MTFRAVVVPAVVALSVSQFACTTDPEAARMAAVCAIDAGACAAGTHYLEATHCHYPPAESPTRSRCAPLPTACQTTRNCECLLRNGPWTDGFLGADAGIPDAGVCSYRLSCSDPGDGGALYYWCTPA